MGTVAGLRTRRYHGLLVVSGDTPSSRRMGLASLDLIVQRPGGEPVRLATHEWTSGTIAPTGHVHVERFDLIDGLPRWRWRLGDAVIERTLAMHHGSPSLAVEYRLCSGGPLIVTVEALCTWRDAHGERHEGNGLRVDPQADGFVVEDAYRVSGPGFTAEPQWYLGVFHREEAARGLAASEDLLRVGRFERTLDAGQTLEISAWAGQLATPPPAARDVIAAARTRTRTLAAPGGVAGRLAVAADAFIVRGADGPDVVAGYPWFGAWARDTMIAYEGLFLATGRVGEGRDLLRAYARTLSDGMLANTADTGRTEYNTADGTLWFLHAVQRHVRHTGDHELAAELIGALDEVIRWHRKGTRYAIAVDPVDGLLSQGADGYALTWMDAVIGGVPVTPRRGKPVELNALWINGLAAVAGLRDLLGRDRTDLDALHATATRSFTARFPSPKGWLYDVVDSPTGDDDALRPNQLLAYGLPYGPLRGAPPGPVQAAGRALLTPLGLRSLAPDEPTYRGLHRGDPRRRDEAYHQGTVWPWLIGPYVDAAAAVGLGTDGLLDGLLVHLDEWGVGSVSETADGDAPHAATGCPFQAWSVAEVLRLLHSGPFGDGRPLPGIVGESTWG
jgi:predicted glycogen debranching enzyme